MIVWSLNVNFVFYLYCQKDGKQGCDVPEDAVRGILCYFVKSYYSVISFRSLTNFLWHYNNYYKIDDYLQHFIFWSGSKL